MNPKFFMRLQRRMGLLKDLFMIMGVHWYHIIVPVFLSFIAAGLGAIGLGLLAPLAQGVLGGSYDAVLSQPVVGSSFGFLLHFVPITSYPAYVAFFALASIIFAANILSIVFEFANSVYVRVIQGHFQYRLNTLLFNRYFGFGKQFFDQTSQGYIRKILEYTEKIVSLVKISQNALSSIVNLVALFLLMLVMSWRLVLFIALIFPILYIVSRYIMGWVNALWTQSKDITLELGKSTYNILSTLPLVWSYSMEDQTKHDYAHLNERLRQVQVRANLLGELTVQLPRLITLLTLFCVVAFISFKLSRNSVADLTVYIVFLYIASRTLPLFKAFNTLWIALAEIRPPIMEVLEVFSENKKFPVLSGDRDVSPLRDAIAIRDLYFSYAIGEVVLKGLTMTIEHGKVTAIVGSSGSGKSTIAHLLMRFYDCPPNTIFWDGADIRMFSLSSIRNHIALVDQDPYLLNATLRANVLYGREGSSQQALHDALEQARLTSLIGKLSLGLETVIGDRGVQLSGGERQRISITRALLKGSDVFLFDEATSSLDSETEQQIQSAIDTIAYGKTAILIAHRLSTVRNADMIYFLDDGRVAESGTFEELLNKKGQFARMWAIQTKGHSGKPVLP